MEFSGALNPGAQLGTQHAAIYARDVRKVYRMTAQNVEALRGVDLNIARGRQVAIVGKSGSGKSTLLHIVGTLDKPSAGSLVLSGTEVSGMPDQVVSQFRNATVGFVFQMNNLLNEFTAMENVMLPGLIAGAARPAVAERALKLLQAVGLGNRADHRPGELSGGEQQRVAIARALLMAPPILLADEPTGNLDQKTSVAIQELLMQVCVQNNVTMLLVTHDPDLAARMPYRIVMEDGRVVEGGVVN